MHATAASGIIFCIFSNTISHSSIGLLVQPVGLVDYNFVFEEVHLTISSFLKDDF